MTYVHMLAKPTAIEQHMTSIAVPTASESLNCIRLEAEADPQLYIRAIVVGNGNVDAQCMLLLSLRSATGSQ